MIRAIKITLAVIGSLLGLFVLLPLLALLILAHPNRVADDPDRIASKANLHLPGYEVVERWDNYNRGSSAWSEIDYVLKTKEPMSEKFIKRLDKLVSKEDEWCHDIANQSYSFRSDSEGDRPVISIVVEVPSGTIRVSYSWWDFFS